MDGSGGKILVPPEPEENVIFIRERNWLFDFPFRRSIGNQPGTERNAGLNFLFA